MPAATYVVDMVASPNPGTSVFYCNILDHVKSGMQARLVVS
jgi:FtsP/CotA-like multicopper oxidase with cupredoxin domain